MSSGGSSSRALWGHFFATEIDQVCHLKAFQSFLILHLLRIHEFGFLQGPHDPLDIKQIFCALSSGFFSIDYFFSRLKDLSSIFCRHILAIDSSFIVLLFKHQPSDSEEASPPQARLELLVPSTNTPTALTGWYVWDSRDSARMDASGSLTKFVLGAAVASTVITLPWLYSKIQKSGGDSSNRNPLSQSTSAIPDVRNEPHQRDVLFYSGSIIPPNEESAASLNASVEDIEAIKKATEEG